MILNKKTPLGPLKNGSSMIWFWGREERRERER
jgi:hypothetical protein